MNHLTQDCSPKTAAKKLKASAGLELPDGWWNWPNVIEAHKLLSREFLEGLPDYPRGKFQGRGVSRFAVKNLQKGEGRNHAHRNGPRA